MIGHILPPAIREAIAEHQRETTELTTWYAMRDAAILRDIDRQRDAAAIGRDRVR